MFSRKDLTKRNITLFSYYRIIAAYLVLLIHLGAWQKPAVLGRFTGVAVPLFAAMSGCLFAMQSDKIAFIPFLKKKTRRILLPYAIWAIVYWLANNIVLDGFIRKQGFSIPGWRQWLLGGTSCHLWFLPALFVSFVLFGGMFAFTQGRIKKFLLAGLFLLAGIATQFVQNDWLRLYGGRLFLFFATGVLLKMTSECVSINTCRIWGGGAIVLGLTAVAFGLIDGLCWQPIALVSGLVAVAVAEVNVPIPRWVKKIADACMDVYLVHVLFTSGAMFLIAKYSPLPCLAGFAASLLLFGASLVLATMLPRWMR